MDDAGGRRDEARVRARDKQRRYRGRLRQQGLRPVQIWVPDVRAPQFARECRRQAQLVNRAPGEQEALEFIDRLADDWD
jgi:hypothetical protein